jgi:hypothetical protein
VKSHAKVPSVGSSSGAKLIALATILLCTGLLAASSASAAARSLETSFPIGGEPASIAVDESNGDIYVIDEVAGTVARFDSTGAAKNFTCGTCSGNTLTGFFFPGAPGGSQVAVDSASGDFYVTSTFNVAIFDSTGESLGSLSGASNPNGFFSTACGVAVDQSNGNVYVGDINDSVNGIIWRYTPSGGSVEEADFSGGVTAPMPVCNVAAAQEIVYGSNNIAAGEVRAFEDADFAIGPPPSPSSTLIDEGVNAIYADSATADLYADKGTVIDVSDFGGADLYSFGSGDFGNSFGVALMPTPTGNAYVSDTENGEIDVYGPPPAPKTPAISSLSPTAGSTAGGTTVILEGTALVNIKKIKFGNATADLASLVEISPTEIEIDTPGHSAGTVSVVVTTSGGTSEDTPADDYTYVAPPAVTGLTPNKGPVAGGNEVEIIGTRLSEASQVEFGTTVVDDEEFIENTDTAIVVEAPAHEVGKVHVRVTTIGGISGKFAVDEYTFVGPAALTVGTAGSGSGTITCDGGACAPTYPFGTAVTLAASPSAGSSFAGWSGGGCTGTGPCTVRIEANTTVTATFSVIPQPPPPPPPSPCVVPKLKGKSLKNAKSALANANCKTGKVTRPKGKKGSLVVKSSKPGAGTTLPTDSKVDLTLGRKPKKRK